MSDSEMGLSEIGEVLMQFEPGGALAKFRDTAIYTSLKFNYELELEANLQGRPARDVEVLGV